VIDPAARARPGGGSRSGLFDLPCVGGAFRIDLGLFRFRLGFGFRRDVAFRVVDDLSPDPLQRFLMKKSGRAAVTAP
jgi:hypothetical protein